MSLSSSSGSCIHSFELRCGLSRTICEGRTVPLLGICSPSRDCDADRLSTRGSCDGELKSDADVAGIGKVAVRIGFRTKSGDRRCSGPGACGIMLPMAFSLALPNDMAVEPPGRGASSGRCCSIESGVSRRCGMRGNESCDASELARVGGSGDRGGEAKLVSCSARGTGGKFPFVMVCGSSGGRAGGRAVLFCPEVNGAPILGRGSVDSWPIRTF